MDRSIEQIVNEIEEHSASGGELFDCPSFRLNANERTTFHAAVNALFLQEFSTHFQEADQ